MVFDLRTCDAAYRSLLEILGVSGDEFVMDYVVDCQSNSDLFWEKHFELLNEIDIKNLQFMVFHVTGSLDNCSEIKAAGLINLQKVLDGDTTLSRVLKQYGLTFDISARKMIYKGVVFDTDYDKYKGRNDLSKHEQRIKKIARRLYYDHCIDGFFYCDDISAYGTSIHKRPEFMMHLVELFPELTQVENDWTQQSKSYAVNFCATFEQFHRFTFSLDEDQYSPYDAYQELTDEQKLKKWMLIAAINRGFCNYFGESHAYIKDEIPIPPEQITSCQQILTG